VSAFAAVLVECRLAFFGAVCCQIWRSRCGINGLQRKDAGYHLGAKLSISSPCLPAASSAAAFASAL
jgi:hypothetical protein